MNFGNSAGGIRGTGPERRWSRPEPGGNPVATGSVVPRDFLERH